MEFGRYQFLPWARRGISSQIAQDDALGASEGPIDGPRATIDIAVEINGDAKAATAKTFHMIGPGDITGVQPDMIIRTEPLQGIANFEPNYLAYIEFYDEDFPWRYTPASASKASEESKLLLRPWLALIVLRVEEFEETKRRQPLPAIKVTHPEALPPPNELHLWAHTHSNMAREMPAKANDLKAFIKSLEEDFKTDPDGLYSRLICPRHLEPNVLYHAFLVPAYETGRLAGLGRPITGVKAQKPSWGLNNQDTEFPVYHRWSFRTGEDFDFEKLVKLLEPRIMDERVGMRPMNCSRPGFVRVDAGANPNDPHFPEVVATNPPVMLLEGALLAPQAKRTPFNADPAKQAFVAQLKALVDLNQTGHPFNPPPAGVPAEDPYVTVPFYGMYHAMTTANQLPEFKPEDPPVGEDLAWYNDLNRDPRTRVAAGFGVRMVQENQEKAMDSAWKQLSAVLEANKKIHGAQFNAKVAERMHERHIQILAPEKMLSVSRSVSARVPAEAAAKSGKNTILPGHAPLPKLTIKKTLQDSPLPGAALSHPFRRALRNQTPLLRTMARKYQPPPSHSIDITPKAAIGAPAERAPGFGAILLNNTVNQLNNKDISAAPAIRFIPIPGIDGNQLPVPGSLTFLEMWSLHSNLDQDFIYNAPGATGGLPEAGKWPMLKGDPFPKIAASPRGAAPAAGFEPAFNNLNDRLKFGQAAEPVKADLPKLAQVTTDHIRPGTAYLRQLGSLVQFDKLDKAADAKEEDFLPVMAYPDFPEPTYEYLTKIDKELLLPNVQLIPPDTISLLRTNQKFIESYLVGLNHEMGNELLWREYPTDRRGSYYRQFWDVRGLVTPTTTSLGAEGMKDIKPIHTWLANTAKTKLGDHNNRDEQGDAEQLVFVVRGELLKKYPNTVIYAQKAIKATSSDKDFVTIDLPGAGKTDLKIRSNFDEAGADYKHEVLFPIYKAELEPDIRLLGFDLTIDQASGKVKYPSLDDDKLGWFFIIAEVPGEPRFGMDLTFDPNHPSTDADLKGGPYSWNDLSWVNFDKELDFIRKGDSPFVLLEDKSTVALPTTSSDVAGIWARSSADMAAILIQRPVMIATHATEMLDRSVLDAAKPLDEQDNAGKGTTLSEHFKANK